MFKVGDLVRIKSCDEVREINKRLDAPCPAPSTMEMYCNKIGKITRVNQSDSSGKRYWISIDISDDFAWRDCEIVPMKFDNFFPLRMWV